MNNDISPNFLSDEALKDIKYDKLGHKSIADALYEIIKISPLPFTIGLFGSWGTGKSTIANFLVDKIKNLPKGRLGQSRKISIVEFDVWKYEKDSLRRQFIVALKEQLKEQGVLNKFSLDERLFAKISINFEGKWRLNKDKLKQFLYILIPGGIAILAFAWFLYSYLPPAFPIYISLVSSLFTILGFANLSKGISQLVTTESRTLAYDKFANPDEFEKIFEDIIINTSSKRILIIFDNLDRATYSKAIELLSTIKTFLEPKSKKCIFLIQCDEEAVKNYLQTIYKYKTNAEVDEFLRKFFNTFIKIPPFINTDLEEYTSELLKQTGIEALYQDDDLITVITKAFRDNPRQIKQFVNIFLSHYMLAKCRESGKKPIVANGIITENPAALAKLLIIRQKDPMYYERITEDPDALNSLPGSALDGFMIATNTITIQNPRALIYFKKSSNELALLDFGDSLRITLEDFKEDDAKKLIDEAKKRKVKDEEIGKFITELLDRDKGQSQNLINIINLAGNLRISITRKLGEKVSEVISTKLKDQLSILKIYPVFNLIKASRKNFNHRIQVIKAYINLLSEGKNNEYVEQHANYADLSENLARHMLDNIDIFSDYKKEVTDSLEKGHFDNTKILESFQGREKAIQTFISDDLLVKFIESIPVPSADKPEIFSEIILDKRASLALSLDLDTSAEVGGSFLRKMDELILAYLSSPQPEREKYFLEALKYVELGMDRYSQKAEQDILNHLGDSLQQAINTFGEYPRKAKLIAPITKLIGLVSEDKKQNLQQTLQAFFQGVDIEMLKTSFGQNDMDMRRTLFALVRETLENRATSDPNVFEVIWPYEDAEGKSGLLIKIIDTGNYQPALNKLDSVYYRVKNKINIAKRLFDKASNLEVGQRPIIYEAINGLRCGGDKELKGLYIDQLQSLIINQPRQTQEIAFDAYNEAVSLGFLSGSLRLKFAESIIEWLNTLGAIGLEQEFALRSVILDSDELSITHKDNLLNCLFDKMIARTSTTEEINLGFELIYQLKPNLRYDKNNKQHFDITYSRLEAEQNMDIKKLIVTGFEKIKPKPISKLSKPFWDGVRKISRSLG